MKFNNFLDRLNESRECPKCGVDLFADSDECPNCGDGAGTDDMTYCPDCGLKTLTKDGDIYTCKKCGGLFDEEGNELGNDDDEDFDDEEYVDDYDEDDEDDLR